MVMDTFGCTPKFIAENEAAGEGADEELFRRGRHDQGRAGQANEIMAPT